MMLHGNQIMFYMRRGLARGVLSPAVDSMHYGFLVLLLLLMNCKLEQSRR